ncbi:MAG: bifunctional glutamate N-acetyltransferase/amino-acid acetyltransferase ArgJ [Acidimicrobiales bacterium]
MSVTDVPGFVAAGIACGIKSPASPDLAFVATEDGQPVTAAGVFTSNKMTAAPVIVCRTNLARSDGRAAAVIINSGNANAATGLVGMRDAIQMSQVAAGAMGGESSHVLVCSTGLIGYELPMDVIEAGIPKAVAAANAEGGVQAATAMMTTDTVAKHTKVNASIAGTDVTFGGIAKGAAMLEPNMATMLAVVTTDAELTHEEATDLLQRAVGPAFNSLTVDGAQSTNDTVLLLANGRAGRVEPEELLAPLSEACMNLAVMMADDAEGSTKTVFITVNGALNDDDAAHVARSIANCQLVKCSWYGKDPYWGRIASEAGASAAAFSPETLVISYGDGARDIVTYSKGETVQVDKLALGEIMDQRQLHLTVDLGQGAGSGRVITTDLTHAYIDENMGTS